MNVSLEIYSNHFLLRDGDMCKDVLIQKGFRYNIS